MKIERHSGHAPRSRALATQIAAMPSQCVGCEGCEGVCAALIDAMILPELILKDRAA